MIPNIEYFKRNYLVIDYEGDVNDNTHAVVFNALNRANSRPGFIMHVQNTLGFVHQTTYLFDETISCPFSSDLEGILMQANFLGDAMIKKGEQEVWRKSFSK